MLPYMREPLAREAHDALEHNLTSSSRRERRKYRDALSGCIADDAAMQKDSTNEEMASQLSNLLDFSFGLCILG